MKNAALPELENKFKARDNEKYKVEAIINSKVYGKKANNQISSLYYLVLWKSYLEEKNTQEPSTAVKHF